MHYMPMMPGGLTLKQFMRQMEDTIETESNALMREAGFDPNSEDASDGE